MTSLVDRRQFLQLSVVGATGLAGVGSASAEVDRAEVLPNGIRLSRPWPPRIADVPQEPVLPPYLKEPPAILPIDLGRQLFVDDFLIAKSTIKRNESIIVRAGNAFIALAGQSLCGTGLLLSVAAGQVEQLAVGNTLHVRTVVTSQP